jgi:MerR family mercuric resistance operon transcriptional regulator
MSRDLLIGEVSVATGVNIETIRYYERIGLVPRQSRSSGGRRSYGSADVQRLAFIRRARDIGFSLADIKSLLALAEPGHRSCADVRTIADQHRKAVESRIADLNRLHSLLSATISKCSGRKAPQCAVLDMLAETPSQVGDQA